MIRVTVEFDDDVMKSYEGVSFQHTDKGLALNLEGSGLVFIPDRRVRAYSVTKVPQDGEAQDQTEEPDGEKEV